MPLNDIIFNKGQGGLSRPLPGSDYVSGLLFYSASLPSGYSTSIRVRQFFQLQDAVNAGINNSYSDETAATGSVTITGAGAAGNAIAVNVALPVPYGSSPSSVQLCNYTVVATDTTPTILAASIASAINAATNVTGFTATSALAVVTIKARAGYGIALNTGTPLSLLISGTATATITQFTGGVAGRFAILYYHISEFFRATPKGSLYVGIYPIPGSYTFAEVGTMQNFASGSIRQIGVYKDLSPFLTADVIALHNQCVALDALHQNISAVLGADISAVTDVVALTDLSNLNSNKVTVNISQDGGAAGAALYVSYGKSITNLGLLLGTISAAAVSVDIAWIGKFNLSNGVECEILSFSNGEAFSDPRVSLGLLNNLDAQRYVFLRKFTGIAGSYFNDSHTATSRASDYSFIENNRTIDKAIRGVYSSLLPALNSSIQLNTDGTLSDNSIGYFTSLAGINLDQMVRDSDLSGYQITIPTTQNILSTGQLAVNVKLLQKAIARNIIVNIGYNVKLS